MWNGVVAGGGVSGSALISEVRVSPRTPKKPYRVKPARPEYTNRLPQLRISVKLVICAIGGRSGINSDNNNRNNDNINKNEL